ncbi:DUF2066 domain-containing protein [Xanthomonas sp. CFBP 8703]|jgi:hypothetical protein|uniref:DUF2066 domain-containing protein n=1 Tax=Xanthomonas bonasiae TaxID=2810351 RepID=A0ABS3B028_9XANT|nr:MULTISPECIES: DUF2066 domain-containing protein [Xanthomonas]MBD7923002.1 DUF2066 domain-containing protein [Xanthomonas surreyensis]MBN6101812.1 DUF2066 domain-containing protein [Xanthomonas bonasiae]
MEPSMRRSLALLLSFALCLPAAAALAQAGLRTEGDVAGAQSPYDAEVPVNSQSEADRNGAVARALGVVLGKISGDRAVMSRPGVTQALRNAKNFVDSYDYRQDQGTSPSGAPTFRTTLIARFRQSDVDGLAAALGLPLWPQPRPKPVLWLAIDDGSGPRLVGVQQSNAARSVLDRAIERGYRLGLPTGSAAEQALVGAIWRQDTAAVASASSRYSPPMQLIGKLYRSKSGGWTADWVFVDSGKTLSSWSVSDADARRAMAAGADGAADALVKRYAKAASTGPAGVYRVVISGIRSADDYLRVSAALQNTSVVRRIVPIQASGDRLELDLDLLSGVSGLNRMLGADSPLQPVTVPVEGGPIILNTERTEYRLK